MARIAMDTTVSIFTLGHHDHRSAQASWNGDDRRVPFARPLFLFFHTRSVGSTLTPWSSQLSGVKQITLLVLARLVVTACRTTQTPDVTRSNLARIHAQKSSQLVLWLDPERGPEDLKGGDMAITAAICDELLARREVGFLLASMNAETNDYAREWLVSDVLYCIDDRRVFEAFAQRLGDDEDRESYYVALYLAKRGDPAALATLNRHYFHYGVASFEWVCAVEAFGKFRYVPATTNLVDSIDAASLDLAAASCDALHRIYPDCPKHFIGPAEAQDYYSKRLGISPH